MTDPTTDLASKMQELLAQQVEAWPRLRAGMEALQGVRTRTIELDAFSVRLQFNPARLASSSAKVDAESIRQRACFLCPVNLPPEQRGVRFGDDYLILANPFPIFPEHFTIAHRDHRSQAILPVFDTMLALARASAPRYTILYNGPRCGASAPDHLHLQAGNRGFLPIEAQFDRLKGEPIIRKEGVTIYAAESIRPFVALESNDAAALGRVFRGLHDALGAFNASDDEPMMNVLTWFEHGRWRVIVFPRAKHRPSAYYADGDARMLLSFGAVDLGGVVILPVKRDFEGLTKEQLVQTFEEVMLAPDPFRQLVERFREPLR